MPHRQASDKNGTVEYACVKSCIGNVVHTLIDTSKYSGAFLPGFEAVEQPAEEFTQEQIINGIDHVAFALPKQAALNSVQWYEGVLNMKRLVVNQ